MVIDGMSHSLGMGFGSGWVIGLIVFALIILLVIKGLSKENNPDSNS